MLPARHRLSPGLTLVEVLVVLFIVLMLAALVLPALLTARESSKRDLCQAHLAQILLGLAGYQDAHRALPAGVINPEGPIRNQPAGLHQGWLIELLPFLAAQELYEQIDRTQSVYAEVNEKLLDRRPPELVCPSEPNHIVGASNYAGCHDGVEVAIAADNNGMLFLNSQVALEHVTDGAAHTIIASEKRAFSDDLGWMSGTRATLRNTGPALNLGSDESPGLPDAVRAQAAEARLLYVGGFASAHPDGANVGYGDGRVEFVTQDIDLELWHRLGNRADGNLLDSEAVVP